MAVSTEIRSRARLPIHRNTAYTSMVLVIAICAGLSLAHPLTQNAPEAHPGPASLSRSARTYTYHTAMEDSRFKLPWMSSAPPTTTTAKAANNTEATTTTTAVTTPETTTLKATSTQQATMATTTTSPEVTSSVQAATATEAPKMKLTVVGEGGTLKPPSGMISKWHPPTTDSGMTISTVETTTSTPTTIAPSSTEPAIAPQSISTTNAPATATTNAQTTATTNAQTTASSTGELTPQLSTAPSTSTETSTLGSGTNSTDSTPGDVLIAELLEKVNEVLNGCAVKADSAGQSEIKDCLLRTASAYVDMVLSSNPQGDTVSFAEEEAIGNHFAAAVGGCVRDYSRGPDSEGQDSGDETYNGEPESNDGANDQADDGFAVRSIESKRVSSRQFSLHQAWWFPTTCQECSYCCNFSFWFPFSARERMYDCFYSCLYQPNSCYCT